MRGKHRAKTEPKRLAWWQLKRAAYYKLAAWRLQLQETRQELRDIAAEVREKNHG